MNISGTKHKKHFKVPLCVALLLLIATSTASANTAIGLFGSPQMTLILSIIVGLLEAFVVERIFHIQLGYLKIVIGNLVSSIAGALLSHFVLENVLGLDDVKKPTLYNVLLYCFGFISSIYIEWPFFATSAESAFLSFSDASLHYSSYAQCVTYSLGVILVSVFIIREKMGNKKK